MGLSAACAPQGQIELPPPVVGTVEVLSATVTGEAQFVGTVESVQTVELRSRIRGNILQRFFIDGEDVQADQLLFQVDPRSPQAVLAESRASLASAQAELRKARADAQRARALFEANSISKAELDTALAAENAARAAVSAAQAGVQGAVLDRTFTEIRAPFDGRIGKTTVNVGNLVDPSDATPMATVTRLDPIYVEFSVSEREYVRTQKLAKERSEAGRREELMVALKMVDGTFYEFQGKLAFISPTIDPTTGTFTVRSVFPNPYKFLKPGMFGKVVIRSLVPSPALLVPQEAVVTKQAGRFVYSVDEDGTAQEHRVETGDPRGVLRVIEEGLEPGMQIISQGVHKVRDGAKVQVREGEPLSLASDPLVAAPPQTYPGQWYTEFYRWGDEDSSPEGRKSQQ